MVFIENKFYKINIKFRCYTKYIMRLSIFDILCVIAITLSHKYNFLSSNDIKYYTLKMINEDE